jgi:hypothetical protein
MMSITDEGLRETYAGLLACCLHDPQWAPDDVAEPLCTVWDGDEGGGWKPGAKQGTESVAYAVVRLKDGRYGLLADWEDYTGHGCQCSSSTSAYGSLDELLNMGIPEDGARTAIQAALAAPPVAG